MAAIPVPSDYKPTNPQQPLVTDKIDDNDRRLKTLERSAGLAARVAALEAVVNP